MRFLVRDFVETAEGYLFAVIANGTEASGDPESDDRVPASLRYVRDAGRWRKVQTDEARAIIAGNTDYCFHSDLRDVDLHGVPPRRIVRHYEPRLRAAAIFGATSPDPLERKTARILKIFSERGIRPAVLGVTGSLLVGAHAERSDIDLVVYDRDAFHGARAIVTDRIESGEIAALDGRFWAEAHARRASGLSFGEYVWHERRKANKFVFANTKVDLSLVIPGVRETTRWRKAGMAELRAQVVEDVQAFDYPARFRVDHPELREVASYTQTYTGQARAGETIEARGWVERAEDGRARLLVGTSREASGEYIKVVRD